MLRDGRDAEAMDELDDALDAAEGINVPKGERWLEQVAAMGGEVITG